MKSWKYLVTSLLLVICSGAACTEKDDDTQDSASTSDTVTTGTQSGTDDGGVEDDWAAFTALYDPFDCETNRFDDTRCEYEICFHYAFFERHVETCAQNTSPECRHDSECFSQLVECMTQACPPGTLVPEDQQGKLDAGIYHCKGDFDEC